MKLIIERKLSKEEQNKYSYASELILNIDNDKCNYEYKRKYSDYKKEIFVKKGNFYMLISSYNHLMETLRKIDMSGKFNMNSSEIELNIDNCLNYIYLTINDKHFKIGISEFEYELLVHLTNFNIMDRISTDEINSLFY